MADAATIALLGTMPAWQAAHWVCMFTGNLVRCSQERLCLKEGKNINILSHFFRFFFRAWNPKGAALHRVKAFPSPPPPPVHVHSPILFLVVRGLERMAGGETETRHFLKLPPF